MNTAERQLRRAARIVDDSIYMGACGALSDAAEQCRCTTHVRVCKACKGNELARDTFELFRPPRGRSDSYWWGQPSSCTEEQHNARVMALLFAAEIVKWRR